ncbi:MAG: cohesin domain-containing protein [bacterium]
MIIFIKQILVICSMLTFLAANSYSAALKIAPDSINITSNQPFTMNINIEDVADLYGASLDLVFDSSKLMVVKVEEGDFLKQAAASTSFLNKIDNEQGRVIIGMSRLGQVSGVNGTGTLVSITMKAKASGTAALRLTNIALKNSTLDTIPATIIDGCINIKLFPVTLVVAPPAAEILSNQTFTVTIAAKDAIDLYGASLDLIFDPDKLTVVKAEEGDFLRQSTTSTSFLNKIDNEQGRIIIGMSRLGQVSGINGTGTLAVITMKPKSSGTATLKLANAVLQDSSLDALGVSLPAIPMISISSAILKIEPSITDAPTNQNVTVSILIDTVVGLYGASFDIIFDPSLLQGVNITEGNFLNQDGLQTAFLRTIDNKNGKIIIGISRLEKAGGINGSGVLCSITFKTKGYGSSSLQFDNICLKDALLDRISINPSKATVNILPIKLKFDPAVKEVRLNRECEVNIIAEGVNDLFGAAFDVIFNPDILEAATITEGNFLSQDGNPTHFIKKVDNGRIIIGMTRQGQVYGVSGGGVLCKIIFNAKQEGKCLLLFENISLEDSSINLLGATSTIGTITVVNFRAGPIMGKVAKADGVTPVKDANVELREMNKTIGVTTTQGNGSYEFNNLQSGDYKVKVSIPTYNIQLISQITLASGEIITNLDFLLPEDITVYPNPCMVSQGQTTIFFSNLPPKSRIRIYTIAGELIKTIENDNLWNPEEVASGVYIYIITNDDGLSERGKIGVIK